MREDHDHKHTTHSIDGIVENRATSPPVYFTVLFYGLIVWGVAFCAFYLLSGWSSQTEFLQKMNQNEQMQQQGATPPPADQEPEAKAAAAAVAPATEADDIDGAALYAQRCAMCHGADGKGGIGPDLTAAEYRYGKTVEAITGSISDGRPGGMPAFGNQMKHEEINSLVEYLLSL